MSKNFAVNTDFYTGCLKALQKPLQPKYWVPNPEPEQFRLGLNLTHSVTTDRSFNFSVLWLPYRHNINASSTCSMLRAHDPETQTLNQGLVSQLWLRLEMPLGLF